MIHLQNLTIRRFRGVREGEIRGLSDVNIIVGRNNSGKTTLLEAILRLLKTDAGEGLDVLDRPVERLWTTVRNSAGGYQPEFWYLGELSKPIEIGAEVVRSETPAESNSPLPLSLSIAWADKNPKITYPGRPSIGNISVEDTHLFCGGATLFLPQDAFNQDIENRFWSRLLTDRRDKQLAGILNDVFGLRAEGFQLLPNRRLMVLFERHGLPLDVQGDGTRAAMRALIVLQMIRGSLFLLEEPESHQHPASLERFARAICRLAREQSVQVIVSTHSAECVRAFLAAAADAGSEGAVFHLTLADGKQVARRLSPDAVETLQTTGVDVRFLDLYA